MGDYITTFTGKHFYPADPDPSAICMEDMLISMIFKKFLNSDLTETEWEAVKTIDNAMLWYDLEELLNEKQPGDPPEIHIKLDYTVRPFEEVEEEYRRLFYRSRED